jgi:hypothetical protein
MNLAIRGIEANLGEQPADSFVRDLHPDLKADYMLANPPFNISDWSGQLPLGTPRATSAAGHAEPALGAPGYQDIPEVEDDGAPFDEKMQRLTAELQECFAGSNQLQQRIRTNLEGIGYGL